MSLEQISFAEAHPFCISPEDSLPPLRFADLRCAARTAIDRRLPVVDERSGDIYSVEDCHFLLNALGRS